MSNTYYCRLCGKAFIALAHLRSHQTRVCSFVPNGIPDGSSDDHDVGTGGGAESASGTRVPLSSGDVDDNAGADPPVLTEPEDGAGPTQPEAHDSGNNADVSGDLEVEDGGIDQYREILCMIDDQHRVGTDIFKFYDLLDQYSKPVVAKSTHLLLDAHRPCEPLWAFLQNCSSMTLSKAQLEELYTAFKMHESHMPEMYRYISHNLPEVQHFNGALRAIRDDKMFAEGWRRAYINLNDLHSHLNLDLAENSTGTFRCPMQLLHRELDNVGLASIKQFAVSKYSNGARTFSCPVDCSALEAYCDNVQRGGIVVCIDIYCDGVSLSNGGTQSISPLRVRFSNAEGIETKWFDIGLCPVLLVGSLKCTATKLADIRRELLHRFLFMVLKPLLVASAVGFQCEGSLLFPRVLLTICDQKQERPFLSLRSAGSTRDCSLCTMVSRETAVEVQARNVDESDNETAGDVSPCASVNSLETLDSTTNVQLDDTPAGKRLVVRTVGAQLLLTISKIQNGGSSYSELLAALKRELPSFWFQATPLNVADIRRYLLLHSCCELPPVLAAFHGLGTEPFLLYKSVGFDTLHVLDLGVMRTFPDSCWRHFATKKWTTLPTAKCIFIANDRLRRIPRGAHLRKVALFLRSTKEKLAGITGRIRRDSCPFLWLCVLGVNNAVAPDDDPLVQAALELHAIHCLLLGVNERVQNAHRSRVWIEDVQKRAFVLGQQFASLFAMRINTKLHRFMRHLDTHLTSFGLIRWGANDANETKHKSVKLAYLHTNRRQSSLATQLVTHGYADDVDVSTASTTNNRASPSDHVPIAALTTAVSSSKYELSLSGAVQDRVNRVKNILYKGRGSAVWKVLSYVTLPAKFPWDVDENQQYVPETYTYRQWNTSSADVRMDGCVYKCDDLMYNQGIVQCILSSSARRNSVFLVVRRLTNAPTVFGNMMATLKYGHKFLQYATNAKGGIQLDLVPADDILHPTIIVFDPFTLSQRFGIEVTDVNRFETNDDRMHSRFYQVSGVPMTSFRENLDTTNIFGSH